MDLQHECADVFFCFQIANLNQKFQCIVFNGIFCRSVSMAKKLRFNIKDNYCTESLKIIVIVGVFNMK